MKTSPDVPSLASDEDQAEYETRLVKARQVEPEPVTRIVDGKTVVWAPQSGSQTSFLQCPIFEVLFHGTRANGKTDCLLMAFAQNVGKGYGADWRGLIIRQTYPQLADVVAKSEKWFRLIFPQAKFNKAGMMWTWPSGEVLMFRHMATTADYWKYHGHAYPFIGWEELTNWHSDECYKQLISCCRSSNPKIPRMLRSTTNPYGVGAGWIKTRFELAGQWWKTIILMEPVDLLTGKKERPRCSIHGHISENKIFMDADPDYLETLASSATNKAMSAAWLDGSWDVTAGGMFDDVWKPNRNIIPPFDIPSSWRIDRSFDWGSSAPFSVCWWAQSDGSDLRMRDGSVRSTVRGDLIMVREWYGWTGKPNEGLKMLAVDVAKGIIEREVAWGWRNHTKSIVRPGPADTSIYTVENGVCIADDMARKVRVGNVIHKGVRWTRADKRAGSRKLGWEQMRKMIVHASPRDNMPREDPGLFVMDGQSAQFLRTVISLPRDEKDLDDVLTTAEDHIGDSARYRVRSVGTSIRGGTTVGMT